MSVVGTTASAMPSGGCVVSARLLANASMTRELVMSPRSLVSFGTIINGSTRSVLHAGFLLEEFIPLKAAPVTFLTLGRNWLGEIMKISSLGASTVLVTGPLPVVNAMAFVVNAIRLPSGDHDGE